MTARREKTQRKTKTSECNICSTAMSREFKSDRLEGNVRDIGGQCDSS